MKQRCFWILSAKQILLSLLLSVLFLSLFSFFSFAGAPEKKVCFKDVCLRVQVVDTERSRERGLMFRKSLNENEGMLFVFDNEGMYNFWMKNTLIPLDIIWISQGKSVCFIKENAMPCMGACEMITPGSNARYVLEVASGFVNKHNIKIGSLLEF
jgi:uncharacterized protein